MIDLIQSLCSIDATSGDEGAVRDFIISRLDGFCEYKIDPLGNIIAYKKGEKPAQKKLLLDAHMDEVGLIITDSDADGFLSFKAIGGIDTAVLLNRRIRINGEITGVIGLRPVHLLEGEARKKLPKKDSLYIDIGMSDRKTALKKVPVGSRAVIESDFLRIGDKILSKALDDRIGCAILLTLLRKESEYDFYASFSVQEEVGLRGARTAAFSVRPDSAVIIEATTAADIAGVAENRQVCSLSGGPAISFMDGGTVYDRSYFEAAKNSGITCQVKRAVAGGNNSGAVHISRGGVRTIAVSVPCRYIHSASSTADINDCENALRLAEYLKNGICSGEIL